MAPGHRVPAVAAREGRCRNGYLSSIITYRTNRDGPLHSLPVANRVSIERQLSLLIEAAGLEVERWMGDWSAAPRSHKQPLVRSISVEGHEIAAHGFRHEDVSGLERDEERRRILRTTEILPTSLGTNRPAGSRCRGRATITRSAPSAPTRSTSCLRPATDYLGNGLADDIRTIRSATSRAAARC